MLVRKGLPISVLQRIRLKCTVLVGESSDKFFGLHAVKAYNMWSCSIERVSYSRLTVRNASQKVGWRLDRDWILRVSQWKQQRSY